MSNKPQAAGTKPDRDGKSTNWKDAPHIHKPTKSKYIFSYGRALEPKLSNPSLAGYYRPWRFTDQRYSGLSKVFYARTSELRISLDISQFSYENVTVKVINGQVVINAFHDTIEDQLGQVKRRFTRRYKLPPDVRSSSLHGKYKKGYLFLWGAKAQADVEQSDLAQVDEKMKTNRVVSSTKNAIARIPPERRRFVRNDVKPFADGRLDKHAATQFQKPKQKSQTEEITIPIAYSPGSPE